MKTENLTIAFVDIKGFTARTSGQSREANQTLLKRFEELVRPMVRAFGGNVVKSIGDAFLLTFRSPTDALHCSMAIQDQLTDMNTRLSKEDGFEVRLALNVGEVRVEGGDIFGEPVNIASRIESLAEGGEIYFSEAVYLVMNKSEVPYVEAGTHRLKGIPDPVKVYRVPKVSEAGEYRLKGEGRSEGSRARTHSLEPPSLPYGGFALERLRLKVGNFRPDLLKDGSLFPQWKHLHQNAMVEKERWAQDSGLRHWLAFCGYAFAWIRGFFLLVIQSKTWIDLGSALKILWLSGKARFENSSQFRKQVYVFLFVLLVLIALGTSLLKKTFKKVRPKSKDFFERTFGQRPASRFRV